jgi:hypothetical protein
MTVSTEAAAVGYLGNGSNKDFAFAFRIPDTGALKVYLNGVLLASNYSATGLGDPAGGSVHYPDSGPAIISTDYIEIIRDSNYIQNSTFTSQGSFNPADVEFALDKIIYRVQQLALKLLDRYPTGSLPTAKVPGQIVYDNTLKVPLYSDGTNWRRVDTGAVVV